MNSRIDALFLEALQVTAGSERDAFLTEACRDNPELRQRLDAMLADDAAADAFFDGPDTVATPFTRSSVPAEKPGDVIGRYKLLQEIGEGGFGIVYLADQLAPVKRRVALKILKPGMDTREIVARFDAERQSLALMDHPNIARIFDGGATDSGRPYFVMELVIGIPLTKYCDDHQLTTRQRLDLFLDVLAAVQHAHQKGIIHRDLKPSNILVSAHDAAKPVIKVIDFGIAKAISLELTEKSVFTAHGHMIGTPQYMSPEQAEVNALDVDTRSDIYSLGVILYELLTGRTPLDAKKLRAIAYAEIQRLIREEEPQKPSTRITTLGDALADVARQRGAEPEKLGKQVRGDLDWIVMKCLEKDRSRRYETANGFAADLRRHLENQPVLARPPGSAYLFSRFVRRHKIGFAAGATVSVALLAGIAAVVWGMVRAEVEAARTKIANEANKQNLHLASMADYASAVKELDEDFRATSEGRYAMGFAGKSRWYEGVVLLTRSLEREPENTAAAVRLYETLRSRQAEKRDRSLFTLKHDSVRSASFSPDGTRIVTASRDKTARIWDAATGQVIGEPLRHEDGVYSANFSPDGTRIVTASGDKTARIWDAATGQGIGEPLRHEGGFISANFSPDGRRIITTASQDETVRIWDAATGHVIGEPMRHEGGVSSANFSPDGSRIVTTGQRDKTARIWDATTGHAMGPPLRHEDRVSSANFSPDGTRIVTASWDKTARIWDTATGQGIGQPMRHEEWVWSANFSPDGTRIVTVSADKTARVWDAATGHVIGQPMRHEIRVLSASFSPEGTRIVTVSEDETARVWDAATGQKMGEPMRHEKGMIMNAIFSPDGSRIVTTSWGDKTARIWNATTGHAIGEPLLHEAGVNSANFSPDGTRIITAGQDNTARVWDAATGHVIGPPLRHEGWVWSANFSPDGTRIVTASTDKTARVWDTATGQVIGQPMRHEEWVWSASFSPDGTRIVTASADWTARVWDTATGQVIGQPMRHEMGVLSASFSPDGTRIVTVTGFRYWTWTWDRTASSSDNTAQVWDAATGHVIGKPLRHEDGVMSANFSPDGSQIVTASEDKTARVWDAVTGQGIGRPMRHEGRVMSANFSPDGTRIVTASEDETARVWDAATGQGIGEPLRHEGRVISANFSPDGTRIVTASGFNIARVWRVLTKDESKAIHSLTPAILDWARNFSGLRFSEDGEFHLIPDAERIAGMTTALPAGPWADLARWINTPTPQRTIDPKSKVTLSQIAERERDFGSVESALRYDPAIPLAHLFLAKAIEESVTFQDYRDSSIPQRAAFLRRYDLDALARETGRMKSEELAALWVRAANHLLGLPPETKIGVGPKPTTAREEAGKAARKALELVPGLPAAVEVLTKLQSLEWSKKVRSLLKPGANAPGTKSETPPTNPCHE